MGKSELKTTHEEIVKYWSTRVDESNLGTDWDEALVRCWRCGDRMKTKSLHRCHIIAEADGGHDEPSNLILLCSACHAEAPSVPDPKEIWCWIEQTHHTYYGQYWTDRFFKEYIATYGPLEDQIDLRLVSSKEFVSAFGKHLGECGIHFSSGCRPFSMASKAWAFRKTIEEFKNRPINSVTPLRLDGILK